MRELLFKTLMQVIFADSVDLNSTAMKKKSNQILIILTILFFYFFSLIGLLTWGFTFLQTSFIAGMFILVICLSIFVISSTRFFMIYLSNKNSK